MTRPLCLECFSRVCHHFAAPPPHLTPRQAEVLRLLAGAPSYKEIATRLNLSPGTVKQYVHQALRKIGLSTRDEGAMWARDHRDALQSMV